MTKDMLFHPSNIFKVARARTNSLVRETSKIIRLLSSYTAVPLLKPVGITFDITDRCQLRCQTCTKWKTPANVKSREMNIEGWKSTIQRLQRWLGEFSFIFAGGEPFLREDIFDIISFAVDRGIHSSVISNGYGFRSISSKVVDSGLDSLIVSLNGLNPCTHDTTRGVKGAHQETLQFIRDVNSLRKAVRSSIRLSLSTILMPLNCNEIVDLVRWVKQEGIDAIHFQPIDPPEFFHPYPISEIGSNNCSKRNNLWNQMNSDLLGKQRLIEVLDQLIVHKQMEYPIANSLDNLRWMKVCFENPEKILNLTCKIGVSRFNVDPYGNVRLCFNMDPIGNMRFSDPRKIYWSERAIKQRRLIRECDTPCHWILDF